MTQNAYARWAVDSINDYRALLDRGSPQFRQWTMVYPPILRPRFLVPIRDEDWTTLASLARAELAARRADLGEMLRHQRAINQMLLRSDEAMILLGASKPGRDAAKRMAAPLHDLAAGLTDLARDQLSAQMASTLALAVAAFNQGDSSQPAATTAHVASVEKRLAAARKAVHVALQSANLTAVAAAATDLVAAARAQLFDQCLAPAAALATRRRGPAGDFSADGRLALRYANAIREALHGIALGRYLAWAAYWIPEIDAIGMWIDAAQTLPFASAYQPPPAVSIAALAADPEGYDGQAVTVEGRLGAVAIVHRGRKAISSAAVADRKAKSITIAVPYIKLDSGGMTPGAYVRVAGVWQQSSKEVAGAALAIDRINLGELGKSSWSDWAKSKLAAVFQPTPHNLAAAWSWEPGANGAGNQLRYGTWFEKRRTR
jgi:hypothetical protein